MAKKKRSNQLLKYLSLVVILLLIGAVVAKQMGWTGKKVLPQIAAEKAERRTIIETVAASGKIFPEVEVKIAPDVSGEVVTLRIEEGDTVKKGDLLARIDPQIYESLVDRAKAAVDGAKSNTANSDARILQAKARIDQFKARKKQVETRRKQFDSRRKQLEARRVQIKAGKEQFDASEQRIQANKGQYKSRQQQLEAQKQQLKARQQQLEARKQPFDARRQQFDARRQQFDARRQQFDARKKQLEARKQQLRVRDQQIDAQIENAQKNYDRNQQLFHDGIIAEIEVENLALQLKTVQGDKESLQTEVASLDAEMASLDAEVASLDAEVSSLDGDIAGLDGEIAVLDGEIAALAAEAASLDAQKVGLNAEQGTLDAEKSTLKAERTRLGGDQLSISAEEIALDGEIASLEAELLGLAGELAGLEADVTAAEKTAEGSTFNVKSAEASLKEARDNLRKTNIYAPVSGIVSKLNVEEGERVVGTSQFAGTEIINISGFDEMEVQVDVSENDILRVNLKDTVIVEIDAYLDRTFKGIVSEIANSAQSGAAQLATDQITNYKVKIRLLRESYEDLFKLYALPFRPGMSASVEIQTKKVSQVITVPIQSVTTRELPDSLRKNTGNEEDEIEEVVFVYQEGKVLKKKVKVGIQNESYIQVLAGLAENEEVISAPYRAISKKLKADMEVEKVAKDKLYKRND